ERSDRRHLLPRAAPLHVGSAELDPGARDRVGAADPDPRAATLDDQQTDGVRVPSPLPVRLRPLHDRGARAPRQRWFPRCRVPPQPRGQGADLHGADRGAPMSVEVTPREEPVASPGRQPLVRLEGIRKYFPVTRGIIFQRHIGDVHAVDGVDLEIYPGETLGLVGETGCGKSTLARVVTRLHSVTAGTIWFDGQDITRIGGGALREVRKNMQMVFQDPQASLNPRKTVGTIIGDPFRVQHSIPKTKIKDEVQQLMELVGLTPEHYN